MDEYMDMLMSVLMNQMEKSTTLKQEDISLIADDEIIEAIMNWLWGKIGPNWSMEHEIISTLPQACKNILSVCTVEGEVNNGGFNQCYCNSKEYAIMAEEGFEAIGAKEFSQF